VRVTSDFYFDQDGEPISLDRWAELMRSSRILAQDVVGNRLLKTVWLGFVDPAIPNARLFGTALLDEKGQFLVELGLWDSRQAAEKGHAHHLAAIKERPEGRP
jgi:hypothetical protein